MPGELPERRDDVAARLVFHAVDEQRWPDLEALFEARGGPKNCWCMVWRATPQEARHTDGASRKVALSARVRAGIPIGLLGYLDGRPVAWCSIAPRSTYRRLVDEPVVEAENDAVWSVACFFVLRAFRGAGVMRRLLAEAQRHAKAHGARVVEGYPVDADSPSYRSWASSMPLRRPASSPPAASASAAT